MEVANAFGEIKSNKALPSSMKDPYILAFADKMMELSNRLNEIDDDEWPEGRDDFDINEDFKPAIREFIANITGL